MGQQEVELIRDGYEAFARGDLAWIGEHVDPEFELHSIFVTGDAVYRGPEGIARYIADMSEAWEEWSQELEDVRDAGDRVAAIVRFRARGRGSGLELDQVFALVWTFRDGKPVRGESYPHAEDGLRALGLEP